MSVRGMGVIYTRTSDGGLLRGVVDAGAREQLIAEYFRPHHDAVSRAVYNAVERWGRCLVVDCHSFPSVPLPYELDQSRDRPEICLGTDEFHSPRSLVNVARGLFHEAGFRVLLDRPFSGALVPESHYRRDSRVMAIMVEVNRALYMNEASGERLPAFSAVGVRLRQALVQLIEVVRGTE
jgi:N-formylglutamate amidohydrolase